MNFYSKRKLEKDVAKGLKTGKVRKSVRSLLVGTVAVGSLLGGLGLSNAASVVNAADTSTATDTNKVRDIKVNFKTTDGKAVSKDGKNVVATLSGKDHKVGDKIDEETAEKLVNDQVGSGYRLATTDELNQGQEQSLLGAEFTEIDHVVDAYVVKKAPAKDIKVTYKTLNGTAVQFPDKNGNLEDAVGTISGSGQLEGDKLNSDFVNKFIESQIGSEYRLPTAKELEDAGKEQGLTANTQFDATDQSVDVYVVKKASAGNVTINFVTADGGKVLVEDPEKPGKVQTIDGAVIPGTDRLAGDKINQSLIEAVVNANTQGQYELTDTDSIKDLQFTDKDQEITVTLAKKAKDAGNIKVKYLTVDGKPATVDGEEAVGEVSGEGHKAGETVSPQLAESLVSSQTGGKYRLAKDDELKPGQKQGLTDTKYTDKDQTVTVYVVEQESTDKPVEAKPAANINVTFKTTDGKQLTINGTDIKGAISGKDHVAGDKINDSVVTAFVNSQTNGQYRLATAEELGKDQKQGLTNAQYTDEEQNVTVYVVKKESANKPGDTNKPSDNNKPTDNNGSQTPATPAPSAPAAPAQTPANNTPAKPDQPANNTDANTEVKTLKHNAALYDENGNRIGSDTLKRGTDVQITGTKQIAGKKYYVTADGQYVKASNFKGTETKLKHNAYVYNKKGKRANKKVLKKGKKIKTFGNKTIKGKKFASIGNGHYVKVANLK